MRCEKCHGTGRIKVTSGCSAAGVIVMTTIPCPECGGCGIAHCCEGERHWALERGFLVVGPEIGAHVLTDLGRAALHSKELR